MSSTHITKQECSECHTLKCLGAENDEGRWICHVCWNEIDNYESSDAGSDDEEIPPSLPVVPVVHEYVRVIINAERLMAKKRTEDILEIYERIDSLDSSYPRTGAYRGLYSLQRKAYVESE